MRNGNLFLYIRPRLWCCLVLILPMRNGNLEILGKFSGKRCFSSYPTYEEWKQYRSCMILLFGISSYPTYEEWKPLTIVSPPYVLKKVLILPMRNGNYQSYNRNLSEILQFLSYLWGMETYNNFDFVIKSFLSSYPTYEEWKHSTNPWISIAPVCSYPTYEEWKLISIVCESVTPPVLILPMRNGNNKMVD